MISQGFGFLPLAESAKERGLMVQVLAAGYGLGYRDGSHTHPTPPEMFALFSRHVADVERMISLHEPTKGPST